MTQIASEDERAPGKITAFFMKWIGIATVVLSAIIVFAQIIEFTTLPDCDSERGSKSLLELARSVQIEAKGVNDPRGVGGGVGEVACKASLALAADASITVAYRFFWDGWTQKVEITGVDE